MVASFSSLPDKVRLRILRLVAQKDSSSSLPGHASVSREWQASIEPYTFGKIHVTAKRLQDFIAVVVGQRRSYVQVIRLHVVLDAYREQSRERKESKEVRRRNTELFNSFLTDFFRALAGWRRDEVLPFGIQLHLEADSPSDLASVLSTGTPHLTERARNSIFRLDVDTLALPSIHVISGLHCTAGRHIEPTSVLAVATSLVNLQSLDVRLNHDSTDEYDAEQRTKFTTSMSHHLPNLVHLNLHRPSTSPGATTAPSLLSWSPVSAALRSFSQQLTSLSIDDTISALDFLSPFLPTDESPAYTQPHWPRLHSLKARNSYLLKKPYIRAGSRIEAIVLMRRVLVGVGRAAGRMPVLRKARVVQCVLGKWGVAWVIVTYRFRNGGGQLEIRGLAAAGEVVEEWKAAVMATRSVELGVVVDERDPVQYSEEAD